MSIHPLLGPGLTAYQRRDFAAAAELWGKLARELRDESAGTCRALARMAGALAATGAGEQEEADDLWVRAKLELETLPPHRLGVDLGRLAADLPLRPEAALASPPEVRRPPRLPRRALLRFGLFVLILVATAVVVRFTPVGEHLTKEAVFAFVSSLRQAWWSPLVLVALGALLYPLGLPATPLMVAGSLVFGAAWGSLYNFLTTFAGALTSYWMARTLGSELLRHLAGPRLKRIERQLARQGFGYLVGARFLPLPFPAVNFGMALAGVRFWPFALSTAIGLAPALTAWTIFYASLAEMLGPDAAAGAGGGAAGLVWRLVGVMALLAFIALLPNRLTQLARRRRYRQLTADRRGRGE